MTLADGARMAEQAIDSGAANKTLQRLAQISSETPA
jgi:anthranilate phosphoribosyltransferase